MIKIEKIKVEGWEPAIRGMRNPLDSWEKSDSIFYDFEDLDEFTVYCHNINGDIKTLNPFDANEWGDGRFNIGPNDLNLMMKLAKSGTEHAKYRRMIVVWMDITAPLYWWKEFDTYKVGTVANSCSTMHTIHKREFTLDDFSCEHMYTEEKESLNEVIRNLNGMRELYISSKNKDDWWQLIQLLPSSYNQKRTVMVNYEALANMYRQRRNHKLDEWHVFCDMIEDKLPYSQLITFKGEWEKELAEDLRNDGVPEKDIPGAVEHIKWFLTPPDRDKMSNDICDLVMNNASESDIKEAVGHSMLVMDAKKKEYINRVYRVENNICKHRKAIAKALHEDGLSNIEIAECLGMTSDQVRDILKEEE